MNQLRFGKHAPKHDYRTLKFKNYLTSRLASPPASYDVLPTVYQKLETTDPTKLFPMDGNDTYGDCTIAALAHAVTVYSGLIGKKKDWSQKGIIKLYMHLTGGIDSGLNELDVLNYWQSHTVERDKIFAYASVEVKNHTHVKQAIQLFGGVYLGFQVQTNCIEEFNAGKPWHPDILTNDGHAVYDVAYDESDVTVLTWGNTQKATWGWWNECVDKAYAILPPEAENPDFSPGFDLAQLKADLSDVAG
jgi:hypothetical protein